MKTKYSKPELTLELVASDSSIASGDCVGLACNDKYTGCMTDAAALGFTVGNYYVSQNENRMNAAKNEDYCSAAMAGKSDICV